MKTKKQIILIGLIIICLTILSILGISLIPGGDNLPIVVALPVDINPATAGGGTTLICINGTAGNNISCVGPTGATGPAGADGINGTFSGILNDTQFNNISTEYSIDESWLTSFINSVVSFVAGLIPDTSNGYLYNDTTTFYFNDTLLNETIDARSINAETDPYLFAQDSYVQDPTGFKTGSKGSISFDDGARNFTLTGATYFINGYSRNVTSESVVIPSTAGVLYYISYTNLTGGLTLSTSVWGFQGVAQVATVYWDGTKSILGDERHGMDMDWSTHEYLHHTIGTRYQDGLGGTFADSTFAISGGHIDDEDNEFTIPSTTTTNVAYRTSPTKWTWLANQTQYYFNNATNMYYDNNGSLTAVPANQYIAVWVFATNNRVPILTVVGQRVDTTLANAEANNQLGSLSLTNFITAEAKVLYRVILRNDASPYEEALDLRATSTVTGSSVTSQETDPIYTADKPNVAFINQNNLWSANQNMTGYNITNVNLISGVTYSIELQSGACPLTAGQICRNATGTYYS